MNVFSPRAAVFLLGMLALHLIITPESRKQIATAEDKPAWQSGISTWTGATYEAAAISEQAIQYPLTTTDDSPRPYTLPSDSNATDAVRATSAQHYAKHPKTPAILASPSVQKPLTLAGNLADFLTTHTKSTSDASFRNKTNLQSQFTFPKRTTDLQESTNSKRESSIPMTFSALPNNALNNFPSTGPEPLSTEPLSNEPLSTEPLSTQTVSTKSSDDNDSNPIPLSSPKTRQLADTSSTTASASETTGDEVHLDPVPQSTSGSDLSSQSYVTTKAQSVSESAPLEAEVTKWYQYPRAWIKGWDSHAEFGLDGSDGNANTLAMQAGLELKRKTERYTVGVDVNYRQASSRSITTEQNGRFNMNFDRLLGDTSWSAFTKHGMEWDKFKPFDLRLNLNGGFGYYWLRSDTSTFATRFGAGASREIGAPMDDWIPEAVFGMEAERQLTSRQKLKGKLNYFPAWEDFGDYRLVSDLSWEILLDGSENLSLKLAATDRYDSTPQGAKPNDVYYSLLLLYKF